MLIEPHPQLQIAFRNVGREALPLLIIDQLVADPERLQRKAMRADFVPQRSHFPGLRARAPLSYEAFLTELLKPLAERHFGLCGARWHWPMCHYSLVTTPPAQLNFLQRIPHIDSAEPGGLATVHYLFKGQWGGTAFYRHRQTGFESIDTTRQSAYFGLLAEQSNSPQAVGAGYVDDANPWFEAIDHVDGAWNRLIVYRRNALHSGLIDNDIPLPSDPATGRLSINGFIDICD